jgi:Ca2+-transporting ATPase
MGAKLDTEVMRVRDAPLESAALARAHALTVRETIAALHTSAQGLRRDQAAARLLHYGPNVLPRAKPPGLALLFLRQFLSPLIYVLLIAVLISLGLQHYADAIFIFTVLLANAAIGTSQEYSAERSASALRALVTTVARVQREGDAYEIDAESLVPGDVVLLESGDKVPADIRLTATHGFEVDESLLTGESLTVHKDAQARLGADTALAERITMAFAGTLVAHGRASGVVVSTGVRTELGGIAASVLARAPTKPPLLMRMERFTFRVTVLIGVAAAIMVAVLVFRGASFTEVFLLAVALAVSAIPEGLPAALSIALAIGMRRMARRNVIARRLVTVEALGS